MNQEIQVYELAPVTRPQHGAPAAQAEDALPKLDVGAVLRRLVRGSWFIALCGAAALVAAWMYLKVTPKMYFAMATLRVEQEKRPILPANDPNGGREDIRALEMLKTIEQGLVSQNNLRRVIDVNALRTDATLVSPTKPVIFTNDADLMLFLGKRIKAELRRGTRLIDVKVEDTDAERACRIASSVIDQYVAATNAEAMMAAGEKAQVLRDNAKRLEAQIAKVSAQMQQYREENAGTAFDKEVNLVADRLKDLNTELGKVTSDRARMEAALRQIEALGANPDLETVLRIQGVPASEDISKLKSDLATREADFAKLQERYRPAHPKYIQAAKELRALRAELGDNGARAVTSLKASIEHQTETEAALRARIDAAQTEANKAERVAQPYRLLLGQLESDKASYDAVQAQIKQSEATAAAAPVALAIADRPVPATKPIRPSKMLVFAVAGLFGSGAGFALVLAAGFLRRRFDSAEEAAAALRLQSLASIPTAKAEAGRGIALLGQPAVEKRCAGAFRTLRTALAVLNRDGSARSTLFVSGSKDEGTSFVAANHAISLARQGYRTLLIDANLHSPALDETFFTDRNASGLANYLEGRPGPGDACRPTHVPELFVLSAGKASVNPSELLSGKKMRCLLDDATRWFHRIVVDAPSLDGSADALLMARQADQVVLVVNGRRGTRRRAAAAAAKLTMAGVQPAGLVFNQARRDAEALLADGLNLVPAGLALQN